MPVPAAQPPHISDIDLVERELERILSTPGSWEAGKVHRAMRYAITGGGRVRPVLSARIARAFDAWDSSSRRAAAAVELVHCASLVIDDLPCMDNERLRRGKPTVHAAFGEATAILSAFALVALAARIVMQGPMPAETRTRMLQFQLDLLGTLDCGELIAGQALDLDLVGETRNAWRARMSELKTVPLFLLAVRAGCVSASPTWEQEEALERFGREFGIAYQLADDLDDGESATVAEFAQHLNAARNALTVLGDEALELHELLDAIEARASA